MTYAHSTVHAQSAFQLMVVCFGSRCCPEVELHEACLKLSRHSPIVYLEGRRPEVTVMTFGESEESLWHAVVRECWTAETRVIKVLHMIYVVVSGGCLTHVLCSSEKRTSP